MNDKVFYVSSKFSLWEDWKALTFIKERISSPSRRADVGGLGFFLLLPKRGAAYGTHGPRKAGLGGTVHPGAPVTSHRWHHPLDPGQSGTLAQNPFLPVLGSLFAKDWGLAGGIVGSRRNQIRTQD